MTRREIRQLAGLTIERVAVAADCTSPTVRLYEADPESVTPKKRAGLDKLYRELAARADAAAAAGTPTAVT